MGTKVARVEQIYAYDLGGNFMRCLDRIKILSLDCFDTILWRGVAQPTDVFFAMCKEPLFKALGITPEVRMSAESKSRQQKWVRAQTYEVSLLEIYQTAIPSLLPSDIVALATIELEYEKKYCHVFQPILTLIRQAKANGLKIIVVSDTYLSQSELKELLFSSEPDLESLIDEVYCSSEMGYSKAKGIWNKVLPKLNMKPEHILHIGDHEVSDLEAAQRFSLQATHLKHYGDDIKQLYGQRQQIARQLLPKVRVEVPLPSLFHSHLAAIKPLSDQSMWFGYTSIGPIMYAFSEFLHNEITQLRNNLGDKLKVAFLLRDGYLPSRAYGAYLGQPFGSLLNISRFTAIASSFDTEQSVIAYVGQSLTIDNIPIIARQLLLPSSMQNKLLADMKVSKNPEKDFSNFLKRKEILNIIFKRSAEYRIRMLKHVQSKTGVIAGDTLMFVDLGYSGTAQTLLKDILKRDLNVDLIGRYMISAPQGVDRSGRKGLLDTEWADANMILALTGQYIASFEMICTQNAPSTTDYTEDGEAILSGSGMVAEQHETVEKVQLGCLQFISEHQSIPSNYRPAYDSKELAYSAAIDLGRFLYFPTVLELDCLSKFQFDYNLGTDKKMQLFDFNSCLREMRTQGFTYMQAGIDNIRMSYPMELRFLDNSLSQLLFSQNRFGFHTVPKQASYRTEFIEVLVMNDQESLSQQVAATATYDGYFSLMVPMSNKFHQSILLGKTYSWIQIDSIQSVHKASLYLAKDMEPGSHLFFDGMEYQDNGLFKINSNGMIYIPPSTSLAFENCFFRLIFRPIAFINEPVLSS